MILTIDTGNTNIVFTAFSGENTDEIVFESRIDTNTARMCDQYAIMLGDIFRLYEVNAQAFTGAIISSVVPPVTRNICMAVNSLLKITPLVVEPGLKTGLNIKIDNPGELGADLVCGAVAAKTLYPSPCIAIDLGTVTKVMALDKDGALSGGVLSPGVGISFEMMSAKTALLPLIGTGSGKFPVIGTNTIDCIRSGILNGTACMLDGLIEKFMEEKQFENCSIVATGGFAEIIAPYCKRGMIVNKTLVSQGLRIIYGLNKSPNNKNALHP
jgi:type III pantothenate kinase